MRRSMFRSAAVLMAAGALVAVGTTSALASTGSDNHVVDVLGTGTSLAVNRSTVDSGTVSFHVSSTSPNGSEITLFRLAKHTSLTTIVRDIGLEFSGNPSDAAKGTRELTEDATFYGLADVVPGVSATVTENLSAGTYYLIDMGGAPPTGPSGFTKLTVRNGHDNDRARTPHSLGVVKMTSSDQFTAPTRWAHRGTITVRNVSDTLHFMSLTPVAPGTTDQEIQAYFDSGAQTPPSFLVDGPSVGTDVQSPGTSLQFTYNLPAGTYALLCFVADDETGMPHAMMGMHKVVVLH